ncbi:hypothetical protein ACFE04_011441 [Oxalis oulophora]
MEDRVTCERTSAGRTEPRALYPTMPDVVAAAISRVQRREALVQRPPFGRSLPLPLINAMKKKAIPGTLKVFSLCYAFPGSAFTVEGGIGVYLKNNFTRAGNLFFIYVAMFRSVVDGRFQTRRNGSGGQKCLAQWIRENISGEQRVSCRQELLLQQIAGKGAFFAIPISMEVGSNQKDDLTAIDVLKA